MIIFSYVALLSRWGWGTLRFGTVYFLYGSGVRSIFLWIFMLIPSFFYRRPIGERLRRFFESVGVLGIKLGQVLSVRVDVVGEEIAKELASLQDNVPPVSFKRAKKAIERSLQQPLEAVFRRFDTTPAAAASVAQVYYAELLDGQPVAVKLVRPKIRQRVMADLKVLQFLSKGLLMVRRKKLKRFKLLDVLKTLQKGLSKELDMRFEASAQDEMATLFRNQTDKLVVPRVFWALTTQDILVSEWVSGHKLSQIDSAFVNHTERIDILKNMAVVFFKMIYEYGFFHADWHPGNILIDDKGRLILVDFGLTGRLDEQTRFFLAQMMRAFFVGDFEQAAKTHIEAGWVPSHTDLGDFSLACRFISRPIFEVIQKDISIGKLLVNLFEVTALFEMEVQEDLLLLQKTLLQIEGIGRGLAPEENIWMISEPVIEEHFRRMEIQRHLQKGFGRFSDFLPTEYFLKDLVGKDFLEKLFSLKKKWDGVVPSSALLKGLEEGVKHIKEVVGDLEDIFKKETPSRHQEGRKDEDIK